MADTNPTAGDNGAPTDQIPDTNRAKRVGPGLAAAVLFVVASLTSDVVLLHADGTHGAFLDLSIARMVVLILMAILVQHVVRNPNRPDSRVAKAGVLAGAVVAVVVGLNGFLTASGIENASGLPGAVPGPAAWALVTAGALLIYLRWRATLWPESAWAMELEAAQMRRKG